jgi:hypothetical protein
LYNNFCSHYNPIIKDRESGFVLLVKLMMVGEITGWDGTGDALDNLWLGGLEGEEVSGGSKLELGLLVILLDVDLCSSRTQIIKYN